MDVKKLVAVRKQAEAAVADMADGALKLKAFEVILSNMIGSPVAETIKGVKQHTEEAKTEEEESPTDLPAKSLTGRILVLRAEGFFGKQKSISEIREELSAHGWHYPLTTLSGTLQSVVSRRKLRRVKVAEGKKKIYKYSNY